MCLSSLRLSLLIWDLDPVPSHSQAFTWSFRLPLREVEYLSPGHTVRHGLQGSLPPLFSLPMAVFLFLFDSTGWHLVSQPLTYLRIGREGVQAGGASYRTSKPTEPPAPLVGGLEEPAPSACQQSQAPSGGAGMGGGRLGSSCSKWKQTPTPNQTQKEIPGGLGCPKLPQPRLEQ